jgi:uncharacterized membrane-anchored protein
MSTQAKTDRFPLSLFSERRMHIKVPEVTLMFWAIKILTTATGETSSDFLVKTLGPAIAIPLGGLALFLALRWQYGQDRYRPWPYWTAVLMVAVFGTMGADALHVGGGVPYWASTSFFAAFLAAVFIVWNRSENTLSIHSINNRRRESFYWLAVITTFALGTAAGDLTAKGLGLGYLASGFLFTGLIAIPAVGYLKLGMNSVLAFWSAYILTRPLGASFADWFAVSHHRGGLALGTGVVSLIMLALIALAVARLARTHVDVTPEQ